MVMHGALSRADVPTGTLVGQPLRVERGVQIGSQIPARVPWSWTRWS
jgi:hypothetical protein